VVAIILSFGGYFDRNLELPAYVHNLIPEAEKIIVNGFAPVIFAMNRLNLRPLLISLFRSLEKEIDTLGKDHGYVREILTCYRLMKPGALISNFHERIRNLLNSEYIPQSVLRTQLDTTVFVELCEIDTGNIFIKPIETLENAILFSFLHPGFTVLENGVFNTMYLTGCPCLSLLKEKRQEIYAFYQTYALPRRRTIAKYLKALQIIRSNALTRDALRVLSAENTVYINP
jgi:hypothetical protein